MPRPKNSLSRNSLRSIILTVAKTVGEVSFEILDQALLPRHYAQTHLTRELLGLNEKYKKLDPERRRKLYRSTLHNLQKEGLVIRGKTLQNVWTITEHGEEYLQIVEEEELLPEDGKMRIFSFDIPERERQKRDKLREFLEMSDYNMLQQSLWVGYRPLSKSIMEKIVEMGLEEYIHIFEASKKGTLKDIIKHRRI